ncbi:uncharacterized protein LOC112904942 [Agrilus planipennis]|uniref:Uncharacterized protein LOC112904942 n=1 Tax=Agrilus planipennis TaxID=224129 RepID=A0A7F5R7U3_AGRPL|nr:uncharacterized protein LOC112904942 [Agrilus planipennis]
MFRFVFILAFVNIAFGANDYESDIRKSLEKLNELKPLAAYYKKNPTSPQVFATGTNLINSTLNDLSEKLAAYDPASVEERNISIERSNIKFSGVLSNLNVGGFSDFVATSLSLSVLRRTLSFTIKLPELKLTTDYDIDGSISFIPIYGKGNLSLQVSGIEATGNGKVSLSNPISIETLNLGYSIGSINVNLLLFYF